MIKKHWQALILCASCTFAWASSDTVIKAPDFTALLAESRLTFEAPSGFADISPTPNTVLQYEHAIHHDSGELEIRYAIRPLGRISIDYVDPHNAIPEPNHLFPLLLVSITNELSNGGNTIRNEYPQPKAKTLFNADWAAASVFDVNPDFSKTYSQGLIIAIHKDNQADAYTVFLYNDFEKVRKLIKNSISVLSFQP